MPELPEVQLVASHLDLLVRGRRIEQAMLHRPRLAPAFAPEDFNAHLANARIRSVSRRGKHILFDLENERTLVVHLRMSGRFSIAPAGSEPPRFTHAQFELGGETLHFSDQRHFGFMNIVRSRELNAAKELCKLAPEPFGEAFSLDYLRSKLKASSRPIKEFLLDQTKVCGLGNIYAAEALFESGIDPRKRSDRLTKPKAELLHAAIIVVLERAVESSRSVPVEPGNIGGNFYGEQDSPDWRVYGREGEDCPACGEIIIRIKQAGRSTFFCRRCQR